MSSGISDQDLPSLQAIDAELAKRSLREFIRQAWPVIEPGVAYLHNWHIDCIAEHLEAVDAGQITRLLINIPPRFMKSICVSVMWPVWSWVSNPESRWLFGSYSGELATKHSVDRRTIIQSDWYQSNWRDRYQLTTDQNVKTEYQNSRRGVMVATGFNGSATGKGGDRIVIDDPINPREARSLVARESANIAFDRTFTTRLNDKRKGAIVLVMQRLDESDPSAHVLKQGGYVHCCLPAEATSRTVIAFPMSGREVVREAGDLLWPEREGPKEIAQAKVQLGSYGYAGQYQQSPAPEGGGCFKASWFRYAKRDGEFYKLSRDASDRSVRVSDCQRFAIVDVAGTEKRANNDPDYTVMGCFDLTPDGDLIWFDLLRMQAETPDSERAIIQTIIKHDIPYVGIEKAHVGIGLIQNIRRKGFAVHAIHANRSKTVRAQTMQIRMEAGTVFFMSGAPWLFDLETELTLFPNATHDDQADVASYAGLQAQRLAGAIRVDEANQYHQERTEQGELAAVEQGKSMRELALESARAARGGESESAWVGYEDED